MSANGRSKQKRKRGNKRVLSWDTDQCRHQECYQQWNTQPMLAETNIGISIFHIIINLRQVIASMGPASMNSFLSFYSAMLSLLSFCPYTWFVMGTAQPCSFSQLQNVWHIVGSHKCQLMPFSDQFLILSVGHEREEKIHFLFAYSSGVLPQKENLTDLLLGMMWPHWADVLPASLTGRGLLATRSSQPRLRYQGWAHCKGTAWATGVHTEDS